MTHQPNLNEPCNKSCDGCAYTNICIGKEQRNKEYRKGKIRKN